MDEHTIMELYQLRSFLAIGQVENLTKAAESIVSELVKSGQGVGLMRIDEANNLIANHNVIVWDKCQIKTSLNIAFLLSRKNEIFIREACRIIFDFWKENKDE